MSNLTSNERLCRECGLPMIGVHPGQHSHFTHICRDVLKQRVAELERERDQWKRRADELFEGQAGDDLRAWALSRAQGCLSDGLQGYVCKCGARILYGNRHLNCPADEVPTRRGSNPSPGFAKPAPPPNAPLAHETTVQLCPHGHAVHHCDYCEEDFERQQKRAPSETASHE